MKLVREAEKELNGKGRVLLRYSGHGAEDSSLDRRPRSGANRPASRSDRGGDLKSAMPVELNQRSRKDVYRSYFDDQ